MYSNKKHTLVIIVGMSITGEAENANVRQNKQNFSDNVNLLKWRAHKISDMSVSMKEIDRLKRSEWDSALCDIATMNKTGTHTHHLYNSKKTMMIFDAWVLSMQFPHFSQACPDVRWKIAIGILLIVNGVCFSLMFLFVFDFFPPQNGSRYMDIWMRMSVWRAHSQTIRNVFPALSSSIGEQTSAAFLSISFFFSFFPS